MKLNFVEKWVVMNPVRRLVQKRYELPYFLKYGGVPCVQGYVLEVGASVGYGAKCLKEALNVDSILALEYDESLIHKRKPQKGVLFFNASGHQLPVAESSLSAVFSFGVLHHIPNWQNALLEWHESLNAGGKVYLEEFYAPLITNAFVNFFIKHPQENRFTHEGLVGEAERLGFKVIHQKSVLGLFGWVILEK